MSGRVAYYGGIVKNGLILDLDAAKQDSYPRLGTSWKDISGNGNNGTLTNGPTFNSANGGSIVFDGIDDYINTSLNGVKLGFTMYVWAKLNQTYNGINLCVDDGSGYFGLGFYDASNKIQTGGFDTAPRVAVSTVTIATNQIYNFTGTYSAGDYSKLYINGIFNAQSTTTLASTGIGSNTTPIKLFKNGPYYTGGNLYLVLLYNRALTAAEVLQNYNATKTRFGL